MASGTILVVEDEASIADAVAARLRSEGFSVEVAADGPAAVEAAQRLTPDLVVLDLMLPGLDGLEVCRRIRSDRPALPVLMLTARDSEEDTVTGLGAGGDDYVTKPFSLRELVARVHALLRRSAQPAVAGAKIRVGSLEIDPERRRVTCQEEPATLTPTEFDLLHHLASRPGVVFTREQLLRQVWGYRDGSGPRTVDSHVRAIRRKLPADLIRTVHGVGYALSEQTT